MVSPIDKAFITNLKEHDSKAFASNKIDIKVSAAAAPHIQSHSVASAAQQSFAINITSEASTQQNSLKEISADFPQPTETSIANAERISQEIFSLGEYFPMWLGWGFITYQLLKKHSPSDAEEWLNIFNGLKFLNKMESFKKHVSQDTFLEIHTLASEKYINALIQLYQRCASKLTKNPKIQDILDFIVLWERALDSNDDLFNSETIAIQSQDEYNQILEFMDFVDKFAKLSAGKHSVLITVSQRTTPIFNWKKFFPAQFTDLGKTRTECMREMNISYSYIKMIAYNWRNIVWSRLYPNQKVSLVYTTYKPVSPDRMPQSPSEELINACTLTVAENAYTSLYNVMMPKIANVEAFGPTAIDGLPEKIKQVNETFSETNAPLKKLGSELIRKFAEENKWDYKLQASLTMLFLAMEKLLVTKPGVLICLPNAMMLTYALETACPYLAFQCFQSELKNLSHTISKLDGFRFELLSLIRDRLMTFPKIESDLQARKIAECIRELHIIAAKPIVDFLEMLFGLARIADEDQFVKVSASVTPSNGIESIVVNFLSLLGLEKIIKQTRKQLDSKTQEKGKAAAEKPIVKAAVLFADLPVLPHSGKSFNDAQTAPATQVKPLSRKVRRAAAASAASAAQLKVSASTSAPLHNLAAGSATGLTASAATTASAEEADKDAAYEAIPTTISDLKEMLKRYNYTLLREGHSHSIYKAEGKESVSVPRHKTGAKGTMAAIRNQVVKEK